MIAQERYKFILNSLQDQHTVRAAKLASALGVSTETIRRDLEYLEKENQLIRVHGGASILQYETRQVPYDFRLAAKVEEKRNLARTALGYVTEGTSIILDHSSTCCIFARELKKHFSNLTIVTNSLEILNVFSDVPSYHIIFLGGTFDTFERGCFGESAKETIRKLNIDMAFVSFGGISLNEGCTETFFAGAELLTEFIKAAQQKIALIDSSKFEHVTLVKVCNISDIDVIITDSSIKPAVLHKYRAFVDIIYEGDSVEK